MKVIYFTLAIFFLVSCSDKEKYNLCISNHNYDLNFETGEFRIDWYKNYQSNIEFSRNEKEQINKLIHKHSIENLKGENYVFGKENLIMQNFNDEITLLKGTKFKSKIYISSQVNLKESKLTKTEIEIFKFKEELYILLKNNKDFKSNMDTLEFAKKVDKRLSF